VARFIKDTNNISKVDSQSWDDNVKTLAHFPDVVAKMNDNLDWTSNLGQAFVEDQRAVMNAVQSMRAKAQQAGSLKTTPQQIVVVTNTVEQTVVEEKTVYVTNTVVQIEPAEPQVIYVPTYNPAVIYLPPPPGQVLAASAISFGMGMAVGAIINNNCNWRSGGVYIGPRGYYGNVNVNVNRNVNVNQNANINRNANVNRANNQKWQPDAGRRNSVSTPSRTTPESRGWSGGASSENLRPTGRQTATPQPSSAGSSAGGRSAFGSSGNAENTRATSARGSGSRGGGSQGGGQRK
jgi:hypothetical protein